MLPVEIVARNIKHDFFTPVRVGHLVLGALASNVRMRAQPHDFDILEEGYIHRGCEIITLIRWNRKFRIVRGSECRPGAGSRWFNNRRILAGALHDEFFLRWSLRHCEADLGPIRDGRTVWRVVKTHDNV